jgi:hypothetical protein
MVLAMTPLHQVEDVYHQASDSVIRECDSLEIHDGALRLERDQGLYIIDDIERMVAWLAISPVITLYIETGLKKFHILKGSIMCSK